MKSVVVRPARNSGCRSTATRKSRLVVTPRIRLRCRASASRSAASALVGACAMTLASIGSNSTPTTLPASTPESHRHRGSAAGCQSDQGARRGQEPGRRILGVEPRLDGMTGNGQAGLADRQRQSLGDKQLLADQVQPGDCLGDRMLDLQPGVDLEEPEVAVRVRARTRRCPRRGTRRPSRRPARRRPSARAQVGVERRRRALLDDLLVAALDRALALEAVHRTALAVGEHLDLDVPRPGDVRLAEHRGVPERARLPRGPRPPPPRRARRPPRRPACPCRRRRRLPSPAAALEDLS